MFPPGFEPGTFRVLGERDNHYTTETVVVERGGNPLAARSFAHSQGPKSHVADENTLISACFP